MLSQRRLGWFGHVQRMANVGMVALIFGSKTLVKGVSIQQTLMLVHWRIQQQNVHLGGMLFTWEWKRQTPDVAGYKVRRERKNAWQEFPRVPKMVQSSSVMFATKTVPQGSGYTVATDVAQEPFQSAIHRLHGRTEAYDH